MMDFGSGNFHRWAWPAALAGSALAAAVTVYLDVFPTIRLFVVVWFLVLCPGMAYVRLLRLGRPVVEWTLAAAFSFGLNSIVAMVMVYTGWWRPEHGLAVPLALTMLGVLLSVVQRPHGRPAALRDRRAG